MRLNSRNREKVCISSCELGVAEMCTGTSVCVAAPTLRLYHRKKHLTPGLNALCVSKREQKHQTGHAHFTVFCGVCTYLKHEPQDGH
jgi:hypothetical protein